jgi:hypothetical protein
LLASRALFNSKGWRKKLSKTSKFYRVASSVAGEFYSLTQDDVLEPFGEAGPNWLGLVRAGIVEPLDAPPAAGERVRKLDRAALDYRPKTFTAETPLSQGDILKRFAWTDTEFSAAQSYGFPKPSSMRTTRAGCEWLWSISSITKWRDAIIALKVR